MSEISLTEKTKVLKDEISRLVFHFSELEYIANQSWLEEAELRKRTGVLVTNEVSFSYHNAAEAVKKRITELEALLPCDEFLTRYGEDLYVLYSSKHPLNRETKLVEVPARASSWSYLPPEPTTVGWLNANITAATVTSKIKMAYFETWSGRRLTFAILAYAADINTVFVAK